MGDKKIAPSGETPKVNEDATKKVLAAKEEGNLAYKNGDTEGAISAYTKGKAQSYCISETAEIKESKLVQFNLFYFSAIYLCEESVDEATLAICLKNRAAVHLKEEDYESVISDCTRYSKSISILIGGSQHTIEYDSQGRHVKHFHIILQVSSTLS